ncbi:unnamed protein product [Eruca vesicaria subsp. sativa]|uniref:NYN domain-containing protein n=1 Tax=Eruca vesicaria subsp. sativa TaxID=29727 RepID=A0ABC8LJT0_ERUVS|nr:unnamed protein product [Eruca vesicaria subsp. sativa]
MENRDPIYVWWDIQSCRLPYGYEPLRVHVAVKSAMRNLGFFGPIDYVAVTVKGWSYGDTLNRIETTGFRIKRYYAWQSCNMFIRNNISEWMHSHEPPAVVVIISCDKGLGSLVNHLRVVDGFKTCIIYVPAFTSERLISIPNFSLLWSDVLANAPLVDPREYDLPLREVRAEAIYVHPSQKSVAVTVGTDLRVFDLIEKRRVTLMGKSRRSCRKYSTNTRVVRYGASGKLFVCASNDGWVNIWSAESWHRLYTMVALAIAIRSNDSHVCYADTRGDVWVVELDGIDECKVSPCNKTARLLFRSSSIITSLDFSPDGRYILSADLDFKIRVTVFPKNPLRGAHEIQSICLGHKASITCIAFVWNSELNQRYLLSGSEDTTVRLWDISSGSLLHTCDISTMGEYTESNESEPPGQVTITDMCTIPNSTLAIVAIQSFPGLLLLSCTPSISIKKVIRIPGESFIPTSISLSGSMKLLWMVSGALNPPRSNHPVFSRVKVISCIEAALYSILGDDQIPGGQKLLEQLQRKVPTEDCGECSNRSCERSNNV